MEILPYIQTPSRPSILSQTIPTTTVRPYSRSPTVTNIVISSSSGGGAMPAPRGGLRQLMRDLMNLLLEAAFQALGAITTSTDAIRAATLIAAARVPVDLAPRANSDG